MLKKEYKNLHCLYKKAYYHTLEEWHKAYEKSKDTKSYIKKLIIYGIKLMNTTIQDSEYISPKDIEYNIKFADLIKNLMATISPKEFINLFPLDKNYNGDKYGMKDYFYSMEYIDKLDKNDPIGENIMEFLLEYQNSQITNFNLKVIKNISALRKFNGERSLAEEFADDVGITTYNLYTDDKGKQFVIDNKTGKTTLVKNNHLKIVK